MIFFNRIRPKQPLKELKWFDIGIVICHSLLWAIVRRPSCFSCFSASRADCSYTQQQQQQKAVHTASEGVGYSVTQYDLCS